MSARNLWSNQPLASPAENVITGWISWKVSRMIKITKKTKHFQAGKLVVLRVSTLRKVLN